MRHNRRTLSDEQMTAILTEAFVSLTGLTLGGNALKGVRVNAGATDFELSQPLGYTLSVGALNSNPTGSQTIYIGNMLKPPVTAADRSKIYIRKAGTLKVAEIYTFSSTTAGSNENWSFYVRLNNATDYLIQTVGASANERVFTNSALTIAVAAGDYIEIKAVNPAWATPPVGTVIGGYVYIE